MPLHHTQQITPTHWSKDFVEHLRTVHFTLIALCAGLIVLASFPSKTEIQVAHDEVSEILGVTNAWNRQFLEAESAKVVQSALNPALFDKFVKFVSVENVGTSANVDIKLTSDTQTIWYKPVFTHPIWITKHPSVSKLFEPEYSPEFDRPVDDPSNVKQLYVPPPSSIKEFERLWDALLNTGEISLAPVPTECVAFWVPVRIGSINCEISQANPSGKAEPMVFSLSHEPVRVNIEHVFQRIGRPKPDFQFYFQHEEFASPPDGNRFVIFPVRSLMMRTLELNGQLALVEAAEHVIQRPETWRQKTGRAFKDAFREVASLAGPFEDSSLVSAERILDAEAKRTGDTFEAAGLKVPAEVAVRCGVLLVLGVQLYLLIHLREFGNRLDRHAGYEVAWIGVYFSKLARAMLFISLLLLPACTVVLLSIRGLSLTEHKRIAWAALVTSNAASLALSFLIFRTLPQPPPPSPATEQPASASEQPESDALEEQKFE